MGGKLGATGTMSEINMTPLIDIVLVVLIIMMVNIPIQIEEMGLKLPSPKPPVTPPPVESEQLMVMLYDDGQVALNRTAMKEEALLFEITRRLRPMSKKNVFIDAGGEVPYGRVVDMVDLAREAGAANVGLAKMKDTGPAGIVDVAEGAMARGIYLGSPRVVGAITEKDADEVMQRLKGNIQQCFMTRLAANPRLTGHMTVKVEVGPQGELLSTPSIEKDSTGDAELQACIAPLMTMLKYQPLGEQNTAGIYYPILFSPG
jgi:biopolymer transport protein ExbD